MPVELALLSATAPTSTHIATAAAAVDPDATYLDWADGAVRQVLDAAGQPLLQVFATRPVADLRQVATAVAAPPGEYRCWTDLAVPRYGDSAAGRAIAQAIAQATEGVVAERR